MTTPNDAFVESPRDMEESGFTPILRALVRSVPGVLAAVFVDAEGECIDYCSALPPFDAKVIAAQMLVVTMNVRDRVRARGGELWFLHIHCGACDVLVRRIADDYALVLVTQSTGLHSLLEESVELAVRALRAESGLRGPAWEPPPTPRVHVEVRRSTASWSYAPSAYWHRGERIRITDVLGRWIEIEDKRDGEARSSGRQLVCFLVRNERGHELTLAHDPERDVWERQ